MIKSRIILVGFFICLFGISLIFRAFYLQLYPNPKLKSIFSNQFTKEIKISAKRGRILDRTGKELAVSVAAQSVFADPSMIKSARKISNIISKQLRLNRGSVYKKLKNKKKRFVWLARKLDLEQVTKLKKLNIAGIGFVEEQRRIYPQLNALSSVLGFVGSDQQGLEGLEKKYDKELKGKDKLIKLRRDAKGRPLLMGENQFFKVNAGKDVYLTIDLDFQYEMEKQLEIALDKHSADSAVGIVLDVETSEILAMANGPTFDLNEAFKIKSGARKNRAVVDSFEPGSTMKAMVIAGALDNNVVKANTEINCEDGSFKVGNRIIREADSNHNFKKLTVSEVLTHSSNVGSSKISFLLGDDRYYKFLTNLGFGKKSSTELIGEAKGILKKPNWSKHLLANISFGHGIAVNSLQMASAYNTIANGGVKIAPNILREIKDTTGKIHYRNNKQTVTRVMSEKTASIMKFMLTLATSKGSTGINARVNGYQVAGKTGTAQIVDSKKGGYKKGSYISSFAGFVPAHNPKYVIYIMVKNPQNGYYGSQVAAPVFSKMASYSIRKLGLKPVLISKKNIVKKSKGPISKSDKRKNKQNNLISKILKTKHYIGIINQGVMPDLMGLSLRDAIKATTGTNIKPKYIGSGNVYKTIPENGKNLGRKRNIKVFLR